MSGGKNRVKNDYFFELRSRSCKIANNCFKNCMWSCQNTANTSVFGGFAFRAGSKKKKKPLVFTIHFTSRVEKISQNTVFSTRSLKTRANSSKGTKISVNTRSWMCQNI